MYYRERHAGVKAGGGRCFTPHIACNTLYIVWLLVAGCWLLRTYAKS